MAKVVLMEFFFMVFECELNFMFLVGVYIHL